MLDTFKKLPKSRQEAILDTAAEVIAANGYHNASIADICQQVDISNGALYKYFKNKESLFRAILDHGLYLMVNELYKKYVSPADTLVDSVRNLLTGLIQFTRGYRQYVCLYVDIGSCSMNSYATYISERIKREGRDFFIGLVEQSKRKGEIDPNIDSDLLAHGIDSLITLFAYSLVSEHHGRRFAGFFKTDRDLTDADKIDIVVRSVQMMVR
ncbi:MAG: TetR/AcrR family transcriptional regulator [Deltaproteobacteria bacterium]|nr:TetR/AcrR family transcriptional regulator [Candidatus Zymogenaceae bacterium]